MSPDLLGTPESPGNSTYELQLFDTANAYLPNAHAPTPVHIDAAGVADPVPNLVVAQTGDIVMQPGDTASHASIQSAKPVDLLAGRDIVHLGLAAQNLTADSVDLIQAGRDIIYDLSRNAASGLLNSNERTIDIAGPGAAVVIAGRTINLGTSGGITTSGNLSNAALPNGGASLSVLAGVGKQLAASAFFTAYVANAAYDAGVLAAYVQDTLHLSSAPDEATADRKSTRLNSSH